MVKRQAPKTTKRQSPKESHQSEIYESSKKNLKEKNIPLSFDYEKKGIYPLFKKRLDQGYEKVSIGQGKWIDKRKIARIYVFYNRFGRYMSYEYPEFKDSNSTFKLAPFEVKYDKKELQSHVNEFKIHFIETICLAGLKWEEYKIPREDNQKKY